jgi:hypothetical protein
VCPALTNQRFTHSHGLEHLGGTDDGLAGNVALGDHHLLGHEDLRRRDLDTEVTTGDHDTVRLLEDLVKVLDTLLVLNLDDDLDARAVGTEHLADLADVLSRTDERGKDHVDAVLDTELEVGLVLLGQGGEVDGSLGEVDTLARGEVARVERLDLDPVALNGDDLKGEDA